MRTVVFSALFCLSACGPPPGADQAEQKLRSGDLPGAVQSYQAWRGQTQREDHDFVRSLAVTTLEQAFASPSPEVRVAAVSAAMRLDDAAFSDAMAERLGDEDEVIATLAAASLLRSHPEAPGVLTRALTSEKPAVRAAAADALGRKVGTAARADLMKLLGDPDPSVRASVADALGTIGEDADAGALLGLVRDASGPVRASALRALARLLGASRSPAALSAARGALADPYLGVRLAALQLLDRSWPASQADLSGSFKDPFTGLRSAVIRAKRGVDGRAGRDLISQALTARDPSLRQAGLNAVAEVLAPADAVVLIRPLLRDADPAVRLASARALLRLDHEGEARPILVQGLAQTMSPELRLSAATDLARLGDPQGIDSLVAALLEPTGPLRVTAAELLLRVL